MGRSPPTCVANSAVDSNMRRLVTNPIRRHLPRRRHSRTYRPNAVLTRHVEFRDQSCVFLGCPRPAARCHIDHSCRFPDGEPVMTTSDRYANTITLFKHALDDAFAKLKHRALQQPNAGTFVWTMPTGHTYTRNRPAIGLPIKNEVVATATNRCSTTDAARRDRRRPTRMPVSRPAAPSDPPPPDPPPFRAVRI